MRIRKNLMLIHCIKLDHALYLIKYDMIYTSLLRGRRFARGDAFVGYQKDTPAAVVFQASNFLRRLREEDDQDVTRSKLEVLDRAGILENMPLNVLFDREEKTELWKDAVGHTQDLIY